MLARSNLTNWYLENIESKTDWVIWLDTNIILNEKSILALLESSRRNINGKMFTSFTNYLHQYDNIYYYDILAYNYGKFFRTSKSPNLTWDDIVLDNANLNKKNKSVDLDVKILTGFGGLALVNLEIIKNIKWKLHRSVMATNPNISSLIICEHWNFQEILRNIGEIYMVKNTDTLWVMDKNYQDPKYITEIKKKLDLV